MEKEDKSQHIKTTLYISRQLHDEAKIMAVLTHTSMSHMMCIALREKINKIKKEQIVNLQIKNSND